MRPRYPTSLKVDAIRRVVHQGQPVTDVAQELGVSEGSVFFWVRRYREFTAQHRISGGSRAGSVVEIDVSAAAEMGTLAAYLYRRRR